MIKVLTVVGTRPELIKLSRLISRLDSCTEHCLVHTGQNFDYELNQIFFDDLSIRKPDYFLDCDTSSPMSLIGDSLVRVDRIISEMRPDAFLVYGDTNSCITALAAKRRKIPIFHMEAGNRCFDQRVPEEVNRKIIDHLSDINFVLSEHARSYLLSEGIHPKQIVKSGSHMHEVLDYYMPKITAASALNSLGLSPKNYILFSFHREENVDSLNNLSKIIEMISVVCSTTGKVPVISLHPRTKKRVKDMNLSFPESAIVMPPFNFTDYISLQLNAYIVLSDSGTLSEESSILGFPAITIRNTHERPEATDSLNMPFSGLNTNRVLELIRLVTSSDRYDANITNYIRDYTSPYCSELILSTVLSFVDYIQKNTWRNEH